jgi:CBS-domain-containing membrane protein
MTRQVLTVHPDTPFKTIAEVLVGQGIDAVPVVDESGAVLGIVSGSDLTCHEETGPTLGQLLTHGRTTLTHARKARARTARELMSSPVRAVGPDAGVCDALALMNRSGVGRLVVLDGGRLVGILARSDLLRVYTRTDESLLAETETCVRAALGPAADRLRISVADGVVHLRGDVERASTACAAAGAAQSVPGVVDVDDDVVAAVDDVAVMTGFVGV